jgi:hypothetical protein
LRKSIAEDRLVECVAAGDLSAPLCSLKHGVRLSPGPAIFGLVLHQTGSHRVFQHVRRSVRKTLIAPEDVIEAFILPHLAFATERFVNAMSGLAFDGVHDLRDGE